MIEYNEILANDRRIRANISSVNAADFWDERSLGDYILSHQDQLPILNEYTYVYQREYFVHPPFSNYGVGDFIFTDGNKRFLVTEVKFLTYASGPTARTNRRKHRRDVIKQAYRYAYAFRTYNSDVDVRIGTVLNLNIQSFPLED